MVDQATPAAAEKPVYPITMEVAYPEKLSRLTTFFRIILVIPHAIVVYVLGIVSYVLTFIAWVAILITGKYPKGLFRFNAGYLRWYTRVNGYGMLLLTDKYPPFKMD